MNRESVSVKGPAGCDTVLTLNYDVAGRHLEQCEQLGEQLGEQ